MLFITNGSYSDFKNIKNNKFLQIQNILSLDSLLLFRNKKSLFRTIFLDKFFKKLKKDWKLLCDGTSDKKFDILIKESVESTFYEKVVKKLSKIEKKLKYIKANIYEYFINKNNFINLCDKIMKTIKKKEMKKISKENFKKVQNLFVEEFNDSIKENLTKKIYIISDEEEVRNKMKNYFDEEKICCESSRDLNIIREKKRNIFKIIIYFVDDSFFDNNINFLTFMELKDDFQINELNPIIFYIKDDDTKKKLDKIKNFVELNFNYIYNDDQLQTIITQIKDDYYNVLYQKYNDLFKGEKYYRFIINEYIKLFKTSLFGIQKHYEKYELLFNKINQDIQFFWSFDFNSNITLQKDTKNDIISIISNEEIKNLIYKFLDDSGILTEIEQALIEFEEEIDEMKNRKDKENKITNVSNNKKDKNNEENKSLKTSPDSHDRDKNEIKAHNNIENNKNPEQSTDGKQKKENNSIKENKLSVSHLSKQIDECQIIMKTPTERKKIIQQKKVDYKFLVLKGFIKDILEEKIKNEILLVEYVVLQKSIIHQFEKNFLEEFKNI